MDVGIHKAWNDVVGIVALCFFNTGDDAFFDGQFGGIDALIDYIYQISGDLIEEYHRL